MKIITSLGDLSRINSETHPQLFIIFDPYKKTFEIMDRTWCEKGVEKFPRVLYTFEAQAKPIDVVHKNINLALNKFGFNILLNMKIGVPPTMYNMLEQLSQGDNNLKYNYIESTDSLDIFYESSSSMYVVLSLYCTEYFKSDSTVLLPRKGTLKSLIAFMEVESELITPWVSSKNSAFRYRDKKDSGALTNFKDYD